MTQFAIAPQSSVTLQDLVDLAQTQGHLTYAQVSEYLPDEATDSTRVERLLDVLDGMHIKLIDDGSTAYGEHAIDPEVQVDSDMALSPEDLPKLTDDPIRGSKSAVSDSDERFCVRSTHWKRRSTFSSASTPASCRSIARSKCR